MFKNIDNIFEKKKIFFKKNNSKNIDIKNSLHAFLKNKFQDDLKGFSINLVYKPKDNSLIIVTNNKIIANEISLCLADIYEHLKKEDIKLGKIFIK